MMKNINLFDKLMIVLSVILFIAILIINVLEMMNSTSIIKIVRSFEWILVDVLLLILVYMVYFNKRR